MHAAPASLPSAELRLRWWLGLLIVGVPLAFAMVTGSIWEDFFITLRCSLNLAGGNGLVYEPGRAVHVFTSPLGVLIPAGLAWGLRTEDPLVILWAFRLVAVAALGAAWLLAAARLRPGWPLVLAGALWATDPKVAAFATNGMETGLLIFFVVLAWRALVDGRSRLAGFALGGLMWTRPDGFIFFGALAAGALLFGAAETRLGWRGWWQVGVIGGLVYLPWFIWAWSTYGSPVPNTIQAKTTMLTGDEMLARLFRYPWDLIRGQSAAGGAFLPPYFFFGPWPVVVRWVGALAVLLTAAVAFLPGGSRPARIAAFGFVGGGAYLSITTQAPWYYPGWAVLAYLALGDLLGRLLPGTRGAASPGRWAVLGLAVALPAAQLWLLSAVTRQLQVQQTLIEWGVRAPLGRELRARAVGPDDTVFLEPLGYIGFFSGLAMRDTPGLCAPEVVAWRHEGITAMPGLIGRLRPDWVVLRVSEFAAFEPAARARFEEDYRLVSLHDKREEVNAIGWLPGRDFLLFDAYFSLWQRRPPPAGDPPT